MMQSSILIYATFSDLSEAKSVANTLISEKIIACANLLSPMTSLYEWEGKMTESTEVPAIFKTTASHENAVIKRIKELHSYSCPCVVCLPIVNGNSEFLAWITQNVAPNIT